VTVSPQFPTTVLTLNGWHDVFPPRTVLMGVRTMGDVMRGKYAPKLPKNTGSIECYTGTQMKAYDEYTYDKYVEYRRDLEMWIRWSFKVFENGADR